MGAGRRLARGRVQGAQTRHDLRSPRDGIGEIEIGNGLAEAFLAGLAAFGSERLDGCAVGGKDLVEHGEMRTDGKELGTELVSCVEGQWTAECSGKRAQDRP